MTKAAYILLGIAALALLPDLAPAQDSAALTAADTEAVMRQANTLVLRQKLSDARAMAQRGDIAGAAKSYQESCNLAASIGSGISQETLQAVTGLTATRLELARHAQSRGDYYEADKQVRQVLNEERDLKVTPNENEVLAFKKHNDEMIALNRGRTPDADTMDRVPQLITDRKNASTLVQDGKVFYEMGKYDEAEVRLNQALKVDPANTTASYYLNLIQQDKFHRDAINHNTDTQERMEHVEKQWILPGNAATRNHLPTDTADIPNFNPYATNSIVFTGPGRQLIMAKLNHYRLESFETGDAGEPLSDVLKYLSKKCSTMDPEHKGVNFLINNNPDKSGPEGPGPRLTATGAGGAAAASFAAQGIGANRGAAVPGAIDPATGLPLAPAAETTATTEQADIGSALVKIPSLTDVRLADVLDAIVLTADKPIKYSIEDFAVVFSQKNPEGEHLFMRTFRVDPNTFYSGLESVSAVPFASSFQNNTSGGGSSGGSSGGGGGGGGGGSQQGQSAVVGVVNAFAGGGQARASTGGATGATTGAAGAGAGGAGATQNAVDAFNPGEGLSGVSVKTHEATFSFLVVQFFATLGIDWQVPRGKAVFFNDRLGYLFVKSTESDLDTIERAIQVLNQVPPQVHIKSRFIEVQQVDSSALGFNWYLGQFNLGNQAVGQAGTAPSLSVPVSAANPSGAFPGNVVNPGNPTVILPQSTDQLLTSGLRNSAPTLATFTGILTDPNFRVTLQALEQRTGTENLGEPEITTISGRQTQMRATEIINVVTGFNFNNGVASTTSGNVTGGSAGFSPIISAGPASLSPFTLPIETGPVLDVVPYVLSDGYTINLALIPSDTEFSGYQNIPANAIPGYNPGVSIAGLGTASSGGFQVPVALPSFTVRQLVTTVNVWDGQTVALGGLISSQIQNQNDTVPIIGDIPVLGRLFTSKSNNTTKHNLMIFVTSTIVDPAGNRVHSDDELPFAQSQVPIQPPENVPPTASEKTVIGAQNLGK